MYFPSPTEEEEQFLFGLVSGDKLVSPPGFFFAVAFYTCVLIFKVTLRALSTPFSLYVQCVLVADE